jgi:hypothetical protein
MMQAHLDVVVTTFSDSIVFSCPANSDGLSSFRYFLIKLLVYTNEFCLLLRGGVSCGSLVHSANKVFGPAMNRAYVLESQVAKHPRIAVDEYFTSLVTELSEGGISEIVRRELLNDPLDGVTYFDSLALATNKVAQNLCGANTLEILQNERSTIETLRCSASGCEYVLSKINWYARFFNHYLDRYPEVEVVTSTFNGLPFESAMVPVTNLKITGV